MKQFFCILFVFMICLNSAGQSLAKIKKIFLEADSVILTSHSYPGMIRKGENPNDRKLVLKNHINPKFIKEQKRINQSAVNYLTSFITKPFQDSIIEKGMCFMPHHTIYIFTNKRISYIDICFLCGEFDCSSNIKFPEEDFDQLTWEKLKEFFQAQDFKYGFNDEDL